MSRPTLTGRAVDPAIGLAIAGYRQYLRLFAESGAATRLSPPAPVRRRGFDLAVTVTERDEVADDVVALTMQRDDGRRMPLWTPGAHVDLFLPSGAQRQYSLCGDPADTRRLRIAVRRIERSAGGGGGSLEVHEQLRVGSRLTVRGPRNAFWLVPEQSYLFVAAGIGITPIIAMVRRAEAAGADWRLVYLGRSRESLPFLDELEAYGDRVVVRTDDVAGVPTPADIVELGRTADGSMPAAVYLCGPPALIEATRPVIAPLVPETRLFSERFSAPPVRGGSPFTAVLARSGRTVEVGAEESLLTAMRREVPDAPYSCQQGFCGSCRQGVLAGEVDHRDRLLLDAERDSCLLPCVSRARPGSGPLVLDA